MTMCPNFSTNNENGFRFLAVATQLMILMYSK